MPRSSFALLVLLSFALSACGPKVAPQAMPAPRGALPKAPQGPSKPKVVTHFHPKADPAIASALMDDVVIFEFWIYYLPAPESDPLVQLDQLLAESYPHLKRVDEAPEDMTVPIVVGAMPADVRTSWRPPGLESLRYSGEGLSAEQASALQETEAVLVLMFAHPESHAWTAMHDALKLTEALARKSGGLIYDGETRQIFTPEVWQAVRLDNWTSGVPDISKQITIHAYNNDEFVRAVTLGMRKFGLPDVTVEEFPWSEQRSVGNFINLFIQAEAEGFVSPDVQTCRLDVHSIQNQIVREKTVRSLKENSLGKIVVKLRKTEPEEGDAENRLFALEFDDYPGPDAHARRDAALGELFGWEDEVNPVRHNEELLAKSEEARKSLPALREKFTKGLDPGEFLQVKAPFATPDDGKEWMWVEISAWADGKIMGLLRNEPFNIPDLHAGQVVEVLEADVFDYLHTLPDGSTEGNETGRLIEQQSGE